MRQELIIACTECKNRNYTSEKNKKNDAEKLELSKFCPSRRKHTPHKETK